MLFGLTPLGVFHTIVSVIAVFSGIAAFVRYRRISLDTTLGAVYVAATVVVCLTGFGIYQHGGFNQAHVLGIITLLTLALAATSGKYVLFGAASPYLEMVAYSATLFFHSIPSVSEPLTRLPLGHPLLASLDAPELKLAVGVLFVLFVLGATLQVRWLRGRLSSSAGSPKLA
jgi:hypothetical protein